MKISTKIATAFIRFYQICLSPLKPACCRFTPSCSAYTLEAIKKFGVLRGCFLGAGRILRCQPLCKAGYDPVPEVFPTKKYRITLASIALVLISLFGVYSYKLTNNTPENTLKTTEQVIENKQETKINTSTRFLLWIINFYQVNISHRIPGKCRYNPSCSAYAKQALMKYGALKGSWLTIKRILRCNPWGGSGDDPVP